MLGVQRLDLEGEFETRTPPRHPRDLLAEALLGERFAVGGGGQRDHRVGVEVIDVRGRQQAVHRSVDRRRGSADTAVLEQFDHLVFVLRTPVPRLSECNRSRRSAERPSAVSVPRSPPEPLTSRTSTGSPVSGSACWVLHDVFPPP